jgi:hypothetical protein
MKTGSDAQDRFEPPGWRARTRRWRARTRWSSLLPSRNAAASSVRSGPSQVTCCVTESARAPSPARTRKAGVSNNRPSLSGQRVTSALLQSTHELDTAALGVNRQHRRPKPRRARRSPRASRSRRGQSSNVRTPGRAVGSPSRVVSCRLWLRRGHAVFGRATTLWRRATARERSLGLRRRSRPHGTIPRDVWLCLRGRTTVRRAAHRDICRSGEQRRRSCAGKWSGVCLILWTPRRPVAGGGVR